MHEMFDSFLNGAVNSAFYFRIHPKNDHQMPSVVVLCGAHDHGAVGACCARILSSHGVQVTLVTPNCPMPVATAQEIELFRLTGNNIVHNVKGKSL